MRKQSKINHIHTSTGETLTRAEFDRRVSEAKNKKIEQQKDEYGYNFCVDCVNEEITIEPKLFLDFRILDCSHNKSVKECIESGKAELAYDIENIPIRCRFHHRKHDQSNLKFKGDK